MEASGPEVTWPLTMNDQQIYDDLVRRKTTSIREWRRAVIWTMWFFFSGAVQLYVLITSDDSTEKFFSSLFVGLTAAVTWSFARNWDRAQVSADAASAAVASWEDITRKGVPPGLREEIVSHAIQLQAAILVEQHQYRELKKAKKGVRR